MTTAIALEPIPLTLEKSTSRWPDIEKLGQAYMYLSRTGEMILNSQELLSFEQWDNLVQWIRFAFMVERRVSLEKMVDALIEKAIPSAAAFIQTYTRDQIVEEAHAAKYELDSDDCVARFWLERGKAKDWVDSIIGTTCGRDRQHNRGPDVQFAVAIMETLIIPFERIGNSMNPPRKISRHSDNRILAIADLRFPVDDVVRWRWMEEVRNQILLPQ